ncbi:MAG: universal stress protein [Polaromonas sp.]
MDELTYLAGFAQYGDVSGLLINTLREGGKKILAEGIVLARAADVPADEALIDNLGGQVGDVVADAARLWAADLVVVGTHGRKGIGRMLLGSGAEQILRLAPVPVLVVRSAEPPGPAA